MFIISPALALPGTSAQGRRRAPDTTLTGVQGGEPGRGQGVGDCDY